MGWTSNYALHPADKLLVRTSVRMTLSAPPNDLAFTCERPSPADRRVQRHVRRRATRRSSNRNAGTNGLIRDVISSNTLFPFR
jgi:hypothetical protein